VQQKPKTGNKDLRPLLTVHGSWPQMIGRKYERRKERESHLLDDRVRICVSSGASTL